METVIIYYDDIATDELEFLTRDEAHDFISQVKDRGPRWWAELY